MRKKQLVLLVSTTKVPLEADITYAGGATHAPPQIMRHVHEFQLEAVDEDRLSLAERILAEGHLCGPWDISGAHEVPVEELRYTTGAPKEPLSKQLIIGTEAVVAFFGAKRWQLWRDCMAALAESELISMIPRPQKVTS